MLKKITGTLLFFGLFALSSLFAETGWYGKAGVSYSFAKTVIVEPRDYSYAGGPGAQLGMGYDYGDFSIEGEYTFSWLNNDTVENSSIGEDFTTNGHQSLHTAMVNTLFHPMKEFDFKPYIGLGLGYGMVAWDSSNTDSGIDGDDTTFVYQVLLGTYYEISQNVSLNFEYRYRGLTEYTIDDVGDITSDHFNELALGLIYHF